LAEAIRLWAMRRVASQEWLECIVLLGS
jgi:hypothetical protein